MSLIRIAAAGFALCAVASLAGAQEQPRTGGPKGGQRGDAMGRGGITRLMDGITLTERQAQQVSDIREKYRAQMQQQRAAGPQGQSGNAAPGGAGGPGGSPRDSDARKKMTAFQEKQRAEIRAVLTTGQRVIFDRNVAEMKNRKDKRKAPAST
ncbi:MAG: Spy/CpxP family protein refolding chaperone [Gemmatimonadaceae bacterium]|nr:Spy/CpxP family protein refolding chaperone [Gemmatimonadaceae bacterium]